MALFTGRGRGFLPGRFIDFFVTRSAVFMQRIGMVLALFAL